MLKVCLSLLFHKLKSTRGSEFGITHVSMQVDRLHHQSCDHDRQHPTHREQNHSAVNTFLTMLPCIDLTTHSTKGTLIMPRDTSTMA